MKFLVPSGLVREPRCSVSAHLMLSRLSSFQAPKTAGLRPMEKKDIPVVHQLLTRYLKQFHLTPVMSQEEVEHWFYPQENIIDTFVVEVSGEGCSGPPRGILLKQLGFPCLVTRGPNDRWQCHHLDFLGPLCLVLPEDWRL